VRLGEVRVFLFFCCHPSAASASVHCLNLASHTRRLLLLFCTSSSSYSGDSSSLHCFQLCQFVNFRRWVPRAARHYSTVPASYRPVAQPLLPSALGSAQQQQQHQHSLPHHPYSLSPSQASPLLFFISCLSFRSAFVPRPFCSSALCLPLFP
jgi:hypothetical protein